MEQALAAVYSCVDRICEAMTDVGTRWRPSRFVRVDHHRKRKIEDFSKTMGQLQKEWVRTINQFIDHVPDSKIISEVADYLIRRFTRTQLESNVEDDQMNLAMQKVTRSLIGSIMDEQGVNASTRQKQELRKLLITTMIFAEPNDGDITSNQHRVLETLWDAIARHTRTITSKNVDLVRRIFHIINITYIIDILSSYFEHIKDNYNRPELVEKHQTRINKTLLLFPDGHPMSIFRDDLRLLLSKLRLLNPS